MKTTDTLQNRWLLGSDAAPSLNDFPESWHGILAELAPEQQSLTALGLMAHYQSLAQCPTAPEPLTTAPILPALDLAMINVSAPSAYHLATRLLAEDGDYAPMMLSLLAERGFALPPRDYFSFVANRREITNDLSPDIAKLYQPWQRHFSTWQSADVQDESLDIDADSWADFMPAYRVYALENLRARDPNACRDLIAECVGQEPAETRVKILHVLYDQLSDADVPYLQTLLTDRSQKVVSLAKQLLIRIGYFGRDDADESEADLELLAKGFNVTEHSVCAVLYREHKKRNKRRDLLSQYGLPALAGALSVTLSQLITGWAYNKHHADDNRVFIEQASHLPGEFIPLMMDGLAQYKLDYPDDIMPIWHRLTAEQRQTLLLGYLHSLDWRFSQLLMFGVRLKHDDALTWESLQTTTAWKSLFSQEQNYHQLEQDCMALGLLLPRELATVVLAYLQNNLTNDSLGRNDPAFYALRVNVNLKINSD